MLRKLKSMFGFTKKKLDADFISIQIKNATKRNEKAAERLREVLLSDKQSKMGQTLHDIVGKM